MTLTELHLFAGAGGGLLASVMLGHRPICAVEIDPYCRSVLRARRDEGWLPSELEVHDDVCTFDGRPWRGRVDLVAGGFPCQDISVAGKGAGLEGARSGLFYQLVRVVREVRPRWVFLENVPAITSRGLDRVLGALAELGFDAEWCVLSAAESGAPHLRKRWWCLSRLADADAGLRDGAEHALRAGRNAADDGGADVAHSDGMRRQEHGVRSADVSVGPSADVPDATRQQDVRRKRGELAGEAGARRCGDAAAVAGGADGPDADCRRQQVGGSSELHQGNDADGLRADGPDADCRRQQVGGSSELHRGGDAPRCDADGLRAADAADAEDAGPTERRLGRAPDGMADWLDRTAAGYWTGEWETQPRLAQGQAHRVARLRALGNGQVPQTAAMAFRILMQRYEERGEA